MDEHIHPDELESAPREQEELNVGPVEARNVGAIAGSAKKTRSKSGCLVCRSRRVKCDGGRPRCERCIKYGSECAFPETKRFDPIAVSSSLANRHKNRSGAAPSAPTPETLQQLVAGPPSSSSHSYSSPNVPTTLSRVAYEESERGLLARHEPYEMPITRDRSETAIMPPMLNMPPLFTIEELMTFFRQTAMGDWYRQPSSPPEFLRPIFPDPDELRSFHHCVTYSFSICVTREDYNPWVQHIAPLFLFPDGMTPLSAEAVRYGMLSTGAAHLSYLEHRDPNSDSDGTQWRILSDRYRLQCVRLLRQACTIEPEFLSDAFGGALNMIIFADVLSTRMEWRELHRMVRNSVIRRGGLSVMLFGNDESAPLVPSPLRRYLAEQVAFLELMAAHICRDVPLLMLGDVSWFDKLGDMAVGDDMCDSIEATFGMHRTVFHLAISTAIYLGRAARDRTNEYYLLSQSSSLPPQTVESGQKVLSELQNWREYKLPRFEDKMDQRTMTGSMAYWHACMIHMLIDLQGRGKSDERVQEYAMEVIRLAREAGDKIEYMMWPMMVASSVLLDNRIRSDARDLYKTFQYQCCFESEGTLRVVEELWKRVDEGRDEIACGWSEIMLEMGMPLLLG